MPRNCTSAPPTPIVWLSSTETRAIRLDTSTHGKLSSTPRTLIGISRVGSVQGKNCDPTLAMDNDTDKVGGGKQCHTTGRSAEPLDKPQAEVGELLRFFVSLMATAAGATTALMICLLAGLSRQLLERRQTLRNHGFEIKTSRKQPLLMLI